MVKLNEDNGLPEQIEVAPLPAVAKAHERLKSAIAQCRENPCFSSAYEVHSAHRTLYTVFHRELFSSNNGGHAREGASVIAPAMRDAVSGVEIVKSASRLDAEHHRQVSGMLVMMRSRVRRIEAVIEADGPNSARIRVLDIIRETRDEIAPATGSFRG